MYKYIYRLFAIMVAMLVAYTVTIQAQNVKKIHVPTPAKLCELLTEQEKQQVTHLTLTGTIDARDFKTMRDSLSNLSVLDLSEVSIEKYKGSSGTYNDRRDWNISGNSDVEYGANAIPQEAFTQLFNNTLQKYLVGRRSLTNIILPTNIEAIEEKAFYDCVNLEHFAIVSSTHNKLITDDGVVYSKNKERLIIFPPAKIGEYELPSSLSVIEKGALSSCTFSLLTFKTNDAPRILSTDFTAVLVKVPEGRISSYSALSAFKVIDKLNIITVQTTAQKSMAEAIIEKGIHPSLINKLTVKGKLNELDIANINNMSALYSLDISEVSLKEIPSEAFKSNITLCSIVFPKMLESVGSYAFWNCSNLMGELVLPESVYRIRATASNSQHFFQIFTIQRCFV